MKKPNDFARLLRTEDEQLQKLNAIVLKAIEEEKLVSEKLMEFNRSGSTLRGRLADWIAAFGGSWAFIGSFMGLMVVWILVNVYWV